MNSSHRKPQNRIELNEPSPQKGVQIIWHGHSCFEVQGREASVVFDPYTGVPGYAELSLSADLVLCSHGHADHNFCEAVRLSGRRPAIPVETIDSWHDDQQGAKRGSNRIHIVTIDGQRIAHLGDQGCMLRQEQLQLFGAIDVLLIPVGGFYTIDAQQAAQITRAIAPKVVVPMHYRKGQRGYDVISEVTEFTKLFTDVHWLESNRYRIGEDPQGVVVFQYR